MENKILFLDFDGVINTPIWANYKNKSGIEEFCCRRATPYDGYVNNYQAICWLNKLYEETPFDIVVTSSWREMGNCEKYLQNGGLNKNIKIIGQIDLGNNRQQLIERWIKQNDFKGDFIILDDQDYYYNNYFKQFLIKTNSLLGFTIIDFKKAKELLGS